MRNSPRSKDPAGEGRERPSPHPPQPAVIARLGYHWAGRILGFRRMMRRWITPLLFIAPALLLIVFFIILPAVQTVWLSFFTKEGTFAGLQNFAQVLKDSETLNLRRFPSQSPPWGSIVHNILWTLLHLPLTVGLGLVLAVLLERAWGATLLKSIIFLGMVTPMIVGGVIIRFLFDENAGLLPAIFRAIGLPGLGRSWTAYPETALLALILGSVWLWVGFSMVLYSAGLSTIPREYYEAASVDGANAFQQFLHITVPSLRPVTTVIVAMTILWELKIFDIVYTATLGGPGGSSMVLALQMYFYAFRALQFHRAAAVATLLTALTLVVGVWFVRTTRAME